MNAIWYAMYKLNGIQAHIWMCSVLQTWVQYYVGSRQWAYSGNPWQIYCASRIYRHHWFKCLFRQNQGRIHQLKYWLVWYKWYYILCAHYTNNDRRAWMSIYTKPHFLCTVNCHSTNNILYKILSYYSIHSPLSWLPVCIL